MKKYELMYILKPSLDDETRKNVIDALHATLTDHGVKITKVDEWGMRDLAYEIKKEKKGYYVVVKMEADAQNYTEFERLARINTNLLRYLITVDHE